MKKSLIAATCFAAMLTGPSLFAQKKAAAGDAAKGKDVFDTNCAVCHNADSADQKVGPGLKGLFKKDKLTNGKKPTTANVLDKINNGGNGMPSYSDMLTDQEKSDLIAYLKTL